jgi:hypothetical protein
MEKQNKVQSRGKMKRDVRLLGMFSLPRIDHQAID